MIAARGIQVFLSSHSPTITAKTDLDSVIVLGFQDGNTVSLPVSAIELDDKHKRFLQRFLDVTKCRLFFAESVILVEGISEALLLPAFARAMGEQYDLDRNGVEVVNVGGVAFEPFARLFNSGQMDQRLNARCALLTDDDRTPEGKPSDRAEKAKTLESGLLRVWLGRRTLEYELFLSNEDMVVSTYRELHPMTEPPSGGEQDERAQQFADRVRSNGDKAVLAQAIAAKADADQTIRLTAPGYIARAIRWVTAGEWEDDDAPATD
jgi:putative ATP-dependent endonuclease of OLD family